MLTASGGPFRNRAARDASRGVTPAEALNHPTWSMGRKITIDSATLMNKGLEVIEARWLFGVAADRIEVLIHPQSVVHSMVEFVDGTVLAQLGVTDMRAAHPVRALAIPSAGRRAIPRHGLHAAPCASTSTPPDRERFPCLDLAYGRWRGGGTLPAVLNAANEEAVAAFLDGRVPFPPSPSRPRGDGRARDRAASPGLDDVLAADAWAREQRARAAWRVAHR